MGRKMIQRWLAFTVLFMIFFTGIVSNGFADMDPSIFGTAPVNPDFQDFIDDPRAEPLFDDEGNYFGFIPLPFALEKYVDPGLLQTAVSDSKYDMRDPNNDGNTADSLLSPVKEQGECGSCWAFASLSVLESELLKSGLIYDFSENNLINNHGFDAGACEGGNILFTSAYLSAYKGGVAEDQDPYPINSFSPSGTTCDPIRYIDNIIILPVRSDIIDYQYVKQQIVKNGALYTSIYYDEANYNAESATYFYNDFNNSFDDSNHAVVIVGWDDLKVIDGVEQPGAFIVRNSWGTQWGENGYFYVSYYDESIAFSVLACFKDTEDSQLLFTKIYQHDETGWMGSAVDHDTAWGANWFIPENSGTLKAVSFAATHSNVQYEIVIYDDLDGFSGSFSNVLISQTGSLQHQGWYTIPLETPVTLTAGDGYAVAVKFSSPDKTYLLPIESQIPGFASNAVVNQGESFVSVDGKQWFDSHAFKYNVAIKGLVDERIDIPCDHAPSSIDVNVSMEGNKVNISWNATPQCDTNQYDFFYADAPTMQNINIISMGNKTTLSKEFPSGTSFLFLIQAKNSKGYTWSNIETFEVPCPFSFLCSMNKSFSENLGVFERNQEIAESNWNLITMSSEESDNFVKTFYSQNSDQIDDLLELKVTVSNNPANLIPLKKSMWAFEILKERLYLGDLYFAENVSQLDNGIPVLVTVDHKGNKGVTFYGQLPYGESGFITSIKEDNCYAYYFFNAGNGGASGRYQKECSTLGEYFAFAANKISTPVTLTYLNIKNTEYLKFDYLFPKMNYPADIFIVLSTPNKKYLFLDSKGNFVDDFGNACTIAASTTIRDTGLFKKSSFAQGSYAALWLIAPTTNGDLNAAINDNNYIFDTMNFNISD